MQQTPTAPGLMRDPPSTTTGVLHGTAKGETPDNSPGWTGVRQPASGSPRAMYDVPGARFSPT
ncbi:hypothetical protein ColLi_06222 [Colletotrichum liriopes]|uniref:Uncharacterized protein n=1 Tax=Colletotrichum liriopes TaxID=708192 RepID=A0AA37GLS9_9PEZI|nr:hypothetical protein ColLi_06222 [Colletotrichum liriopes]